MIGLTMGNMPVMISHYLHLIILLIGHSKNRMNNHMLTFITESSMETKFTFTDELVISIDAATILSTRIRRAVICVNYKKMSLT